MQCRLASGSNCQVSIFLQSTALFVYLMNQGPDVGTLTPPIFRYPIVHPRKKCTGDRGDVPGVRSYNVRPAHEQYDVYCYMDQIKGEYYFKL